MIFNPQTSKRLQTNNEIIKYSSNPIPLTELRDPRPAVRPKTSTASDVIYIRSALYLKNSD